MVGFVVATALFYNGFGVFPIMKWDWSLTNIHQNCLYVKAEQKQNSASYNEIVCLTNSWKNR